MCGPLANIGHVSIPGNIYLYVCNLSAESITSVLTLNINKNLQIDFHNNQEIEKLHQTVST